MDVTQTVYLNIAGFNIQIFFHKTKWEFVYKKFIKETFKYYQGFINQNKPRKIDYFIDLKETSSLLTIIKKPQSYFFNLFDKLGKNRIATFYQISLIQFQMILREILLELLANNQGFIMHGSAVGKDNIGYIFTGRNGAGKSTAMNLINPKYSALADDTVIIKKENGRYYLYQTPFIEKNNWVKKGQKRYLINKIFFLRKAKFYKIDKIDNKNLLTQKLISQFWTKDEIKNKQFKTLMKFISQFNSFYYLYFAKNRNKLRALL